MTASAFDIALFANKRDTDPKPQTLTLDELASLLTEFDERIAKDGPLWSPGSYGEVQYRLNKNVAHGCAFAYDFDDLRDDEPDWEPLAPYYYIGHTTHSHTYRLEGKPKSGAKWRVILPLVAPVAAEDCENLWRRGRAALAPTADKSCKDPSRMFYLPACMPRDQVPNWREPEAFKHCGQLLDPTTLPELPEPRIPRPDLSEVGADPSLTWPPSYLRAVVENEVAELLATSSFRNARLNRAAFVLGRFVGAGALLSDGVFSILWEAADRIGLIDDPDDGPDQTRASILSGLESGMQQPRYPTPNVGVRAVRTATTGPLMGGRAVQA